MLKYQKINLTKIQDQNKLFLTKYTKTNKQTKPYDPSSFQNLPSKHLLTP